MAGHDLKDTRQNENVDADEQLATLSEGKVADAVKKTSSRSGPYKDDISIDDYSSGLERFVYSVNEAHKILTMGQEEGRTGRG